MLAPEQKADLIAEVKRLLERSGVDAKVEAAELTVRACQGCIICTCMICI